MKKTMHNPGQYVKKLCYPPNFSPSQCSDAGNVSAFGNDSFIKTISLYILKDSGTEYKRPITHKF